MPIMLILITLLMAGVVFVNGWTDAPNAIATVVSTRVLSPSLAVKLAVVFNFLGVFVMTSINAQVANTLSNIVEFPKGQEDQSLVVFAAAMLAIVIWAVAAWYFGIPTSESHALIAGITGGAMAIGGLSSVNGNEWSRVLFGLVFSSVFGFAVGYIITKIIELLIKLKGYLLKPVKRRNANKFFAGGQIFGALAMAFMHGAQDGQKFIGTYLLGLSLVGSQFVTTDASGNFTIGLELIIACSLIMGIGTSVGGYRIIKAVGMDMVKVEKYQGFSADLSASLILLYTTVAGIPVSTTHTKTTAIMGVGAARSVRAVNWGVVKEMFLAWFLTFPGCGLIAFIMAKLFMFIANS